ncbi:hypothetical protein L1887_25616 [Cichorium endivia]|nr:hypothetical protein L1887_25616 [Cichorium endivia]
MISQSELGTIIQTCNTNQSELGTINHFREERDANISFGCCRRNYAGESWKRWWVKRAVDRGGFTIISLGPLFLHPQDCNLNLIYFHPKSQLYGLSSATIGRGDPANPLQDKTDSHPPCKSPRIAVLTASHLGLLRQKQPPSATTRFDHRSPTLPYP